ncbi:MAG: DUF488 family protein [Acidobacteria bacterium]|nr:DUF488 family protein [Acidobacteriota bacterium]
MSIRIVRFGDPRRRVEGLRVGTVKFPPRGMPKGSLYDTWLPELAPSRELLRSWREERITWRQFARRYRSEMRTPECRHLLALLAALSHETELSVGCYCADEEQCHRSILRELLGREGAEVVA